DFITPPVNDPFTYGQIAAANAISDVYAMGGRPLTCLNLFCFPTKKLEQEVLHQIAAGALNKITESGAVLAGGHTVEDDEPKFGLAVTGVVHPGKYWANNGAREGDVLLLTKPVGSGVIFNANIKSLVSDQAMKACLETLVTLNKTAAEVMAGFEIHAATDVTGFGLAGHGYEMAAGSDVRLEIRFRDIPIMGEALEMYEKGVTTGVNAYNRQLVENHTRFQADLPDPRRQIVYDPQTSGGLLAALPEDQGRDLQKALVEAGASETRIIGRVARREDAIYLSFV
ncbi:MAG: selenide, water dikinase SelD, partial [Desulfobacterales bacterium]|nr:selenide, water dikinase SelD [Desulfobacterales bacterium]